MTSFSPVSVPAVHLRADGIWEMLYDLEAAAGCDDTVLHSMKGVNVIHASLYKLDAAIITTYVGNRLNI